MNKRNTLVGPQLHAILFANSVRAGIEAWLAGIPRRVGYTRPLRDFFVNQFVREHSRSLTNQRNHYLRIAECIGADILVFSEVR